MVTRSQERELNGTTEIQKNCSASHNPTKIEVFTNSSQYKNANIANFVLAVPLECNWTNKVCSIKIYFTHTLVSNFTFTNTNKEENCKYIWEYKVGNNANIVNFVHL